MYLCRIPDPIEDEWFDDADKVGWIPVIFKQEIRWAKPCLPLGTFNAPSQDWIIKNRKRFKVWVEFEESAFEPRRQDSLIYVGFYPMGGENPYPEPQGELADNYPNVAAFEWGNFRVVIDKAKPKLDLYLITSPAISPVEVNQVQVTLDPHPTEGNEVTIKFNDLTLLTMDPTNIELKAPEKITLNALLKVILDSEVEPVVLALKLITWLNSHTHPTPTGPSGIAVPPATPLDFASIKVFTE